MEIDIILTVRWHGACLLVNINFLWRLPEGRIGMAKGFSRFGKFALLNWVMLWLILINFMIVMMPSGLLGESLDKYISAHNYVWYSALIIGISYFLSHGIIILCTIFFEEAYSKSKSDHLKSMIGCLDFTEKAVLREFVLQRRSVINLPVTEPAVRNLLNAGILTYAYGTPAAADDNVIKAMMISLEARPFITYRILGLSKAGMSEEQIEQILNERPKFAAKSLSRS